MAIEPDRSDLESERVQLLLRQTPLALVGSLVILLAMFYVLWPLVPRWSLLIWGGAGFGLIGARIALWWPLRREGPAPRNARRIRRAFTGLTLGMGLQWSVVPIFFFPEQSFPHQVFISFMAGGLTAGAIASYSAVFWQAPSIFLPILIPLTTRLFLTESEFAPILGSLALLFTVISLALTRNVYTTTKRALSLSLEKNELVRTLEVARRQAEALNEGLRKEIEEREHQEQARISAEAREERLQAMAEAAPVPLCLVRRKDGIVLYANEPFRVLFGWNQGLEESRHIHPLFADSSGWRRVCDAVDTQGSLSNHLQALQTTGGSSIQAVISCRPLLIGGESAVMCGVVDTSPLARAEENLRTSEERFRTLAESSLQGLMIHRDGKALFVNTTFARMFGYADPAEIMAMEDVNQLVHAEDRMRMVEYAASRMRGEDPPAAYEVRGVKKDGTLILLEAQARLVPWVKGPAIQLVNRDITESRRAQEALHQNRRLLQTVLDTVPQWMFVKDMQARYVMVNRSMAEFFGKSPEDFVHRSFMQITEHKDMDDVNLSDQADAQVLTTNSVVTVPDMRVYTREGALRIRHVIKFPLRNDQGQVAGIVGISEDITERLKAEKELRASEQRYRDLIEGSLQGIIIHRGFKPLFVNKAFAEIFGFASPRELLAVENLESYIDSADRTKLRQISATPGAEADRTGQLVELNVKRKDGTPMRLQSFTTEILWEGTPAILAALIDITERSRLEEQLRQAQKMEAVGQLAGGVAHDFNNILQVIYGYALLSLDAHDVPKSIAANLRELVKAADGAANLTRQMLAFSRREVIQARNLDVNDLISNQMKMLRRIIGENIQLSVRSHGEPVTVHADPGMLEQVLLNICLNARDAMPEGGALTIETRLFLADTRFCQRHTWARVGTYAQISIADTGLGIDPEIIDHIFEPFFTTKEVGRGSGLGLSMVYGILRQHKGMVMVESEPGKGAVFHLYLPKVAKSGDAPMKSEPSAGLRQGEGTILVAEDDDRVRNLLKTMLENVGYTVLTARDGEDALKVFEENKTRVDLVILDVVMPRLGGREVVERLYAEHPDLPMVLSTGYSGLALDGDFVKKYNLQLIRKPFVPSELMRVLQESMTHRRPRSS